MACDYECTNKIAAIVTVSNDHDPDNLQAEARWMSNGERAPSGAIDDGRDSEGWFIYWQKIRLCDLKIGFFFRVHNNVYKVVDHPMQSSPGVWKVLTFVAREKVVDLSYDARSVTG
jgi:hypothetical protein